MSQTNLLVGTAVRLVDPFDISVLADGSEYGVVVSWGEKHYSSEQFRSPDGGFRGYEDGCVIRAGNGQEFWTYQKDVVAL